ncbi:MAG: DUF2283 domain-containing protein [Patescibacteria group bacterium]|nr:DUF2283 domain-containing protein [Patescibacteria group bacterium]
MKYKYDPESDVLAITLQDQPFSYAQEAGDFIVHYNKEHVPVYIEILNAHTFVSHALQALPDEIFRQTVAS